MSSFEAGGDFKLRYPSHLYSSSNPILWSQSFVADYAAQ